MTFASWSSYVHLPRARITGDTTPNIPPCCPLGLWISPIPTFHACLCFVLVWIWVFFFLRYRPWTSNLPSSPPQYYHDSYEPQCQVYVVWWIEIRAMGTWAGILLTKQTTHLAQPLNSLETVWHKILLFSQTKPKNKQTKDKKPGWWP